MLPSEHPSVDSVTSMVESVDSTLAGRLGKPQRVQSPQRIIFWYLFYRGEMVPFILANCEAGVGMSRGVEALTGGAVALDVIEQAIRVIELDSSVRSVGYGGSPNVLGVVECDSSIMCGLTLRTGAVGALKDYFHAISVARKVMERTPHVMIVGEGATRFAAEMGEKKGDMLSPEAKQDHEKWLRKNLPKHLEDKWPDVPLTDLVWPSARTNIAFGTTCLLVRGQDGNWGGGVSTSGWAYKYPGRLGDSPIIGAGMYVDNRYGAVACTHTGEMTIRAGTARSLIAYMKRGASSEEAVREGIVDLQDLKGGFLGGVVIHCVDRKGDVFVASTGLKEATPYWYWQDGMTAAERRAAVIY